MKIDLQIDGNWIAKGLKWFAFSKKFLLGNCVNILIAFHLESEYDAEDDPDLSNESIREKIFMAISDKAYSSTRLFAHFLLPYRSIEGILMEFPRLEEKLLKILCTWYKNNQQNTSPWSKLKAVLLFLKKKN